MRRNLKNQEQTEAEVETDTVDFDDVLSRELDAPTVLDLDLEPSLPGGGLAVGLAPLDTPLFDLATSSSGAVEPIGTPPPTNSVLQDSTEEENAALRAELLGIPTVRETETLTVESSISAVTHTATSPATASPATASPATASPQSVSPNLAAGPIRSVEDVMTLETPDAPTRGVVGFDQFDFWDRYDEATASADLFAVPPAAITVVVGSLDVAMAVAERCRSNHWVSECDVFVLTERPEIPGQPTWTPLRRPSDVVAVLEDGGSDFPLIVLDIPRELPAWVRPLVARLRQGGVGLVHYVLGSDPSDEDLATWHGELGRPSVLDLACPATPERVLELLDRGEPVSSVAGMDITTELLLALRLNR